MNDSVDFDDDDFEDDEDEFDHFVAAQDTVYGTVVTELTDGKKQTHWTWFIFPVLTGIGESPMAMFYSLRDTAEAKAYLAHPLLGDRLLECMRLIRGHKGTDPRRHHGRNRRLQTARLRHFVRGCHLDHPDLCCGSGRYVRRKTLHEIATHPAQPAG